MASKINEAKDSLMTEVEDNPESEKNQEETNDNEEYSFEKYIKEEAILFPKESEKVYLDVIFGKNTEMTKEEYDGMYARYKELEEKENLEEENLAKNESGNFEPKENKEFSIANLDELNGCLLDKDSEFYKKYKKNIENFDFQDINHPMNDFEIKIVKDRKKNNINV